MKGCTTTGVFLCELFFCSDGNYVLLSLQDSVELGSVIPERRML